MGKDRITDPDPGPVDGDVDVGARARHWDGVYARRGERGVSWFTARPTASLQLIDAAGITPDRPVIDVGAGASTLVDQLLARGHTDLTALDVSARALSVAQARLGPTGARVHWQVADLLAWQPARRYGLWHDRAVFHFLTDPADHFRYRTLLHTALAPDGVLVIATFAADGPPTCSGLPTARYTPEQLLHTLGGPTRWATLAARREHHTTPTGADQAFTWLALQRRHPTADQRAAPAPPQTPAAAPKQGDRTVPTRRRRAAPDRARRPAPDTGSVSRAGACTVVVAGGTAVGCAEAPGIPHPTPAPTAVALSGWKLTLPVAGPKGGTAIIDPAAPTPPWLVSEPNGDLTLWAPVAGSTTPNSSHARTELDSLTPFRVGTGKHVLAASVTVTQLPGTSPRS